MLKGFWLPVAIVVILSAVALALPACGASTETWEATVTSVVDGDTVTLDNGLTVSYSGVTAPKNGQRGYSDAKKLNESLVLNKQVKFEVDSSEKYNSNGDVLAYAWIGDEMISQSLVSAGLATFYPNPNNDRYDKLLSTGQTEAKAAELGIWGPARRLDNGAFIQDSTRDGRSTLTIRDGQEHDVVVMMTTLDKTPVLSVYIRAGEAVTIKGVRDGTYDLYVTKGEDWDSDSAQFTKNRTNLRFDKSLDFETTETQISSWAVTLQPTIGGNASTQDIGTQDFPAVQ